MTGSDDAYHGLAVSSWDLWRDDTAGWPDRAIYRDVIERSGTPVLDLGCASGRLLLDYLREGVDIDGLDASADMLELVRTKARRDGLPEPALLQQRLQELSLPRQYATILGASSALQLVTDPAAAHEAVRRILQHLQPNGTFAGSFAFEWRPGEPLDTGWELLFEKRRPADGATVRCWTREWREPDLQLWHTEQRFEVVVDEEVVESEYHRRSPEGRWYTKAQATELLASAGFVDIELFHDFTHEPVRPDDRLFWFRARHPGER